jgi:hypothetical protein
MADNKYGEIYTEDELVEVVQLAVTSVLEQVANNVDFNEIKLRFNEADIREVARADIERTWKVGEPLFILRGQDRRALGAVRWYRDHQWPNAPREHLEAIDEAVARFEAYRNIGSMKEPD